MLFNSFVFILVFLPIVLSGYFLLGHFNKLKAALIWLVASSLFFYGWWNPKYLLLIVISVVANFGLGQLIQKSDLYKKPFLILGLVLNLGALAYFKYANFFVDTVNTLTNTSFHLHTIILPLAISFFTFQQITYIIDAYKGATREYSFLHYCLFVTFFPQLIAGPIVHHTEMMPQFKKSWVYRLRVNHLSVGITIFCLGLFKKVVFADTLAGYATPVFSAANLGIELSFFEAWVGALAYTFQLYFDFSGYSDMALGIARMFGILLPLNFYSPYKSRNIIEFWRRWHMTLSRFLRDYVYIAMGGNRKGNVRRYINLLTTMLVGGLWHGAGWTFVIWGGLHGFYLIVNHFWQHFTPFLNSYRENNNIFYSFFSWSVTFLAVIFAWVLFRAESLAAAKQVLSAMIGLNGLSVPESMQILPTTLFEHEGFFPNDLIASGLGSGIKYIIVFGIIALIAPNTVQIMQRYLKDKNLYQIISIDPWLKVFQWRPTVIHVILLLAIAFYALQAMLGTASEFLYFQF